MRAFRFVPSRWILVGGLTALGVVALLAPLVAYAIKPPEWRVYLDEHLPVFDPDKPMPGLRGEWLNRVIELQRLARKPAWESRDIEHLTGLVRSGYPRSIRTGGSESPLNEDEWGAYDVWSWSGRCLSERLHSRAPIPPGGRDSIIACWLDELEAGFAERRVDAAMMLLEHKAVEEGYVWKRVESLLDDPDQQVREVIALQLGNFKEKTRADAVKPSAGSPLLK